MAKNLFDGQSTQTAHLADLIEQVAGGIVSKHLLEHGPMKQVLFAMDAGQELTEHRSPVLATVHVLQGRLTFRVGQTDHDLKTGDWLMMPAQAAHSAHAVEPTRFLLTMIKS